MTNRAATEPQTTAQSLASLVKSCRDLMRKDKGLTTDLDRLPMLTWIMFLKFLDDMEQIRDAEAKLEGKRFQPAIESPYRWRDWAAQPEAITRINGIHFTSTEEIYTLGHLYESMLKEMRDAAGENGEFSTPRPLVQFIVTVIDPRLGET